jgi:hypothetical protein
MAIMETHAETSKEGKELRIKQVQNGFTLCLTWREEQKTKGEGCCPFDPKEKEYILKALPAVVEDWFEGKVDGSETTENGKKMRMSFDEATSKVMKDLKDKEDNEENEENEGEEE